MCKKYLNRNMDERRKRSLFRIAFVLLSCLLINISQVQGGSLGVTLTANSNFINEVTSYSFLMSGSQILQDNCIIVFTFPAATRISFQSPISCSIGNGFLKTPSCTVTSSTPGADFVIQAQCTQSGTIDRNSPPLYRLTINNVKNAFSAQAVTNIKVQTFSGSAAIDTGLASITFQPKMLPASWGRLTTADPSVGVYADLTLQLTITTDVPSNGQIIFVLPKWDTQNRKSMVDSITSCTAGSDLAGNTPTCTAITGTTQDQVKITSAMASFSSQVTSGKSLQITLNQVRNPPTLQVYSTFEIQTTDQNGNLIEKCSGISLFLQTVGSLSGQSSVTLEGNTGLNQIGTYQFFVKLGNPMPSGGWIRIVLPPEVQIVSLTFTAIVQISQSATASTSTVQVNGVQRTAIDLKNGISQYIQEENGVLFKLGGIRNPISAKPTTSFELYTFDNIDSGIDKKTSGLAVSATRGALRGVRVYPSDALGILQYAKVYQLQFTTQTQIDSTNAIVIQFPLSSFSMSSRTCSVNGTLGGRSPASGYTCSANSDTYQVTIKNFLQSGMSLAASSQVVLTVQNLQIRNPASTASASGLIEVFTALDSFKVDYDASQTFTASASGIASVLVTASSYQTNKEDVTYTVSVVPQGYVVATAQIIVSIPEEVTISDSGKLTRQCGQEKLSGFKGTPECTIKGTNQILLRYGFSRGPSDDPPSLVFSLPGFKNPRSLHPTGAFQVSLWDGTKLLYNSTGLSPTLQMTSVSAIKLVNITRASQVNGALTNYTFRVTFTGSVVTGDQLVIENPKVNSIRFTNTTKCYGTSANLYYNQPCVLEQDQTQIRVTLQARFRLRELEEGRYLQSFSTSQATLLLVDVYNPPSMQPTSSFTLTQYSSDGFKVETSETQSITIRNSQPGQLSFSQLQIKPDSMQTGASTLYTVTIDPSNYLPGMLLHLVFPAQLLPQKNLACTPVAGVTAELSCAYQAENRTLVVRRAFEGAVEPKVIRFQVGNVTNPAGEARTESFRAYTRTPEGWLIDQREADLYIDFKCALPCQRCIAGNNTGCASCHIDDDSRGLPRHLWQNYCVDRCPTSTFIQKVDLSCKACYDKICIKCSGSSRGQCQECTKDYSLINGSCVKLNDSTYYFPVIILTIVWLAVSVWATLNWEKTWFLTTAILGLTLIEYVMLVIEALAFLYFGFGTNLQISLIASLGLPYVGNIAQLLVYLAVYRKQEDIQTSLQLDRRLHLATVSASGVLSHRFFKFLYSNLGNKPYLSLESFFEERRVRLCFHFVQALSCLSSAACGANAFWNHSISGEIRLSFTQYIDLERLLLSGLIIALLILESVYLRRPRPYLFQKLIDKVSGTETLPRPTRVAPKTSAYDEIPNLSYATQIDGPSQQHPEEEVKRRAMVQVLDNLKLIRPELLEARLQELLEPKRGGSPLRRSEPTRLTDLASRRFRTSPKRSGDSSLEEERKLMTEPVTPRALHRLGRAGVEARQDIREDGFPLDPKAPKITTRDQEVNALRNSIELEWDAIQREKVEIKRMREEMEQQRVELEKIKRSVSISARSLSEGNSEKILENVSPSKKELYTARSKGHILDAVRESQSELIDEDRVRLGRNINSLSKDHSKDSQLFPGAGSRSSGKSNKTEILKSLKSHRNKCHGHSPETKKSVSNYRKKHGSTGKNSVNDSRSFNPQLGRVQGPGEIGLEMFNSPRNLQQYLESNLDEHQTPHIVNQNSSGRKNNQQTKIYYSDKSESSVEDLMDETPSNYNIPNGRLDGRSVGNGAFLPPGFKDNRKLLPKVVKKKKKRAPKLFREETTQELDESQYDDLSGQVGADSRSHSILRTGKRVGLERRQAIPKQDQLSRAEGAASNISFDQRVTEQSEDKSLGQMATKKTFTFRRGSQSNTRIDGILPINSDRIKALEAAYLTKLHRPHKKGIPSSNKVNLEDTYNQIINEHSHNISQRIGHNTHSQALLDERSLGLTQVQVLPVPQINNFNS